MQKISGLTLGKGATYLRRVLRKETYDTSVLEEYILLSAAYAVLLYTQQALGANFAPNCLLMQINSGEGRNARMSIDRSSVLQTSTASFADCSPMTKIFTNC